MYPNGARKWTILFYTNGNNELEPEMYNAMCGMDNLGEVRNVHVAMQIGRESYDLVKLIRNNTQPRRQYEQWEGVRRYALRGNRLTLLESLGKENMAAPKTLMEFLIWGFIHFPAERYMLVLGGHSWQFLGTMTDYSQQEPNIMGIPGMAQSINFASRYVGAQVDLVVADTCNFNNLEVVYELGADPFHATKNLMTYVGEGPLNGFSYRDIILYSDQLACLDTKNFLTRFLSLIGSNLVACEVNHDRLRIIKELFNKLAIEYSYWNLEAVDFRKVLDSMNTLNPWFGTREKLNLKISEMIVSTTGRRCGQGVLTVACKTTSDLEAIKLYSMLSFAKENYWTNILSEKSIRGLEPATQAGELFYPVRLGEREVCRYIALLNPSFSPEKARDIFLAVAKLKHWNVGRQITKED